MRQAWLPVVLASALGALAPVAFAADKLDGDDKKWLASVEALIQPDEQKVFRSIPKADRAQFQAIFWARRNPQGPMSPTNPFKDQYLKAVAEADKNYTVPGKPGSRTDCGHAFLILGPPDQTHLAQLGAISLDSADAITQPGERKAETWTYKERPDLRFQGGALLFDERCELPMGSPAAAQLNKVAAVRIVNTDVTPETSPDGRLVPLLEQLKRRKTPAQVLFITPRQDLTFEEEAKLVMRHKGSTYLAGLLRVPTQGLTVKEEGGKKRVALLVATQLVNAAGQVVSEMDGERTGEVTADGRVLISYSTLGAPGSHTLRIAVADPASEKGAVLDVPVTLPDLGPPGFKLSDPQVFSAMEPVAQQNPQDPLADFLMGSVRLVPRFGNVFKGSDSVHFVCLGYNATPDKATGKPSVTFRFEVYKGLQMMTAGADQALDTEVIAPVIGPVPLASMPPGTYSLKAVVMDKVANKQTTASTTYEVVP